MTNLNHEIIRTFFAALSRGDLTDDLFTPDMICWTTSGGTSTKEKYQGGVKLLQSLFPNGLSYTIDLITAEEDRAAAEVQSRGTLINGEDFHNVYVFIFRFRDGKIAAINEHTNPDSVRTKILPLMKAAMSKVAG